MVFVDEVANNFFVGSCKYVFESVEELGHVIRVLMLGFFWIGVEGLIYSIKMVEKVIDAILRSEGQVDVDEVLFHLE